MTSALRQRIAFSRADALRHLVLSACVAVAAALVVFGLWYPSPYRQLLQVGPVFGWLLLALAVCGPLLTLVLGNPAKSRRERALDLTLVGVIQLVVLAYGLHGVWASRPVVLAFERDRLVVVTANEVDMPRLPQAPAGLQQLPALHGVLRVGVRRAADAAEMFQSTQLGLSGVSPSMRPDWWLPWRDALPDMRARAQPLTQLIARRPEAAATLRAAAQAAGHAPDQLLYLPLTSSRVKEWVALLDQQLNIVGYVPVDGFI